VQFKGGVYILKNTKGHQQGRIMSTSM